MRITAKRSKLLFALLPIMAIIFYALTYSPELKASVTFKPVRKVDNIVALKEVPTSGTPSDYSPLENISIANYILFNASYFQGVSDGSLVASVGFINYNQTIYGMRKVKDGNLFTQSISTSSLKSIAEQHYVAGDSYLYRVGSKIKGNSAEFGDVYQMSGDAYMIKYGMPPMELCKYVLKEETVLDAKLISFPAVAGEGDYVFGFTLDPKLSTEYYQNEVRTLSGSSSEYPQFESVYLEITIGSDWYVKSVSVSESYWIDKPIKALCSAKLTEVFSDINDPRDVPEAEPFLSFVPDDNGNGGGQYTPPDDPTEYLAAAFGKYIQGEPLNLDCNISLPAYKFDLNVKLHIDLEHKFADILLADELYIGYRGDTVYFAAGTLKGSMRTDAFAALLPELLEEAQLVSPKLQAFLKDFDFDALKGDSLMELLFADAEVVKTETETAIVMPFMLSGVRFDIRMNLSPEPYEFRSIDAKISILTVGADVSVVPCDSIAFPAIDDSYRDFTAAADFILPTLRTAGLPAYRLTVNGSFTTPHYSDTVSGELHIDRALNAVGTLALDKLGKTVTLAHVDNTLYLSVDGMTLSLSDSELLDLLPLDTSAQPNIDLSAFDLGAILSGLTELTVDNNTLRATLAIDGVPVSVALCHNGEILTYLHIELPDVNGMRFAFDVDLAASAAPIAVEKPENAVSALAVYDYVKPLLADARQAGEIRLSLQYETVYGLPIVGNVRIGLRPLYFEADLSVDGVPVRAVLGTNENAAPLYVSVGNARFKTTVEELPSLLSEVIALFGIDAPQMSIPSLSAFSFDQNGLHITALGMTVGLTVSEQTEISVSANNVDVRAAVTFGDGNAPTVEGDYTDLTHVVDLLKSATATIQQSGFSVSGVATVDFDSLQDTAAYTVDCDNAGNVRATVSLKNMGIAATVTKVGNDLYIECGLFTVKALLHKKDGTQAFALPAAIADLLPASVVSLLSGNTPTARDLVALVPYLKTLSVTDSTATVRIDTGKFALDMTASYGLYLQSANVALTLPRADAEPIALNASAALAVGDITVATPNGTFVDLENDSILSILEGKALTGTIVANVTTDAGKLVPMSGTVTVAVMGGKPQFALSVNAFDTQVDARLWNDCLYLRVGDFKMTFNIADDKQALLDFVDQNLPPFVGDLLDKLLKLDIEGILNRPAGDTTVRVDFDAILDSLSLLDGLDVTVPIGNAHVRIRLPWPQSGVLPKVSADFSINQTVVALLLENPTLAAIDAETFDLTPLYADTYVDLMKFAAFLPAISDTVKATGFELTVTDDVRVDYIGSQYAKDETGKAIRVQSTDANGQLVTEYKTEPADRSLVIAAGSYIRIVPEGAFGEKGYFLNFAADLTVTYDECVIGVNKLVQSRRCTDNIKITLVREPGGKFFYIDFRSHESTTDSTKIKLSYEEVMGMIGYVKEILGLPPTVLDRLTDGYYDDSIDTSIFDSLDLTNLRASLVNALDAVERILNVVSGDETHTGALQSIGALMQATTLDEAAAHIRAIRAVLADNDLLPDKSDDDIIDSFGAILSAIGKLTLSFDTADNLLTLSAPYRPDETAEVTRQSLTLGHDGTALTTLNLNSFTYKTTDISGDFRLRISTADAPVTVTPPAGSDNTFNQNPTAAERTLWNDLGPIRTLFENLLHTTNLGRFHIGGAGDTEYGKIHMSIPNYKVEIDIPFTVKVDFIADKPAVYAEIDFSKIETSGLGGIASKFALDKNVSRLFYYDGRFLLSRTLDSQRLNSTPTFFETTHVYQTQYVAATLNDLIRKDENGNMDTAQLMKYVYFLFPLSGTIQTPINNAVEQGITDDFNKKSEIVNRFSFSKNAAGDTEFAFSVDVGELSRISAIKDASIKLTTGAYTDRNGQTQAIFRDLFADIWFLKGTSGVSDGIGMKINAQLVNPGQDIGTIRYTDWQAETQTTKVWDGYQVREEVKEIAVAQIPAMIDRLSAFTDTNADFAGTIEKPYVSTKKYMRLKK